MPVKRRNLALCYVALYERLSREDGDGVSLSIANQQTMLEEYAKERGFKPIRHYTDDGYSGSTFNRPGWKRLIDDIEQGLVFTVIVKDLSRIGRNYLETGFYTEMFFPRHNVRLIAIGNGIDSAYQQNMEYTPFMNLINDWYVREYRKRMRTAWKVKGDSGQHIGTVCMYGYKDDPDNKGHWLIDEEAAEVVREIFQLTLDGMMPNDIARLLKARKVYRPSYYRAMRRPNFRAPDNPYDWQDWTVRDILRQAEYKGQTVNHKTKQPENLRKKAKRKQSPETWQIFDATQEPIVEPEVWDAVQQKLGTHPANERLWEPSPLKGMIYCGDCGKMMRNVRQAGKAKEPGQEDRPKDYFACSSQLRAKRHNEIPACTPHRVNTDEVTDILLENLRFLADEFIEDERFLSRAGDALEGKADENITEIQTKIRNLKVQHQNIEDRIALAYEKNFANDMTNEEFSEILMECEQKQMDIAQMMEELEALCSEMQGQKTAGQSAKALLRTECKFTTLTREMVDELVEKIVVYEQKSEKGRSEKKIKIYLKGIGVTEVQIKGGREYGRKHQVDSTI